MNSANMIWNLTIKQNSTLGHKKHCVIQHLRDLQTRLLMIFFTSTPPLSFMEINLKGSENRYAWFIQSAGSTPQNAIYYM